MGPQEVAAASAERVSKALRDYQRRAHRLIDRRMRQGGASFAQARMLVHIAEEGSLRSTDLADAFGYAPRTVTEAIDGLERDGLVRRLPDPGDRRAKRISLTELGSAAAAAADELRRRFVADAFGALTPDERSELVRLIAKLDGQLADLGG